MLYLSTRCSRRRVIVLPLSRFAPPSPPTIVGKRHKKQHRQEALKKKQHRSNNSKFALSQREIPSKSMFDHPSSLQIQGAYSCILYSIFKAKCKKKLNLRVQWQKISTASLKNSKDVSAPSSRFSKYGGLGNMNRKYLEMQFLCTYVGIVSIMAFELCTCSWKANVYTPIFLLSSTKKALYYSQKGIPKSYNAFITPQIPDVANKIISYRILCTYSVRTFLSPWKQV